MKKTMKRLVITGLAGALLLNGSMTAFAANYTVQKGDSLKKIAKQVYGEDAKWETIYEANKDSIKNPKLIYAGQVLTIPDSADAAVPDAEQIAPQTTADDAASIQTENGIVQTQAQEQVAQQTGIDLSWLRNEDGSLNVDQVWADAEEWNAKNGLDWTFEKSVDKATYYTASINAWAQNSDRGAAWKQLMDRYQMPYYLGNYITPTEGSWGVLDYTIILPAGITADEVDGVAGVVELLMDIGGRYDGLMDSMSWKWITDDNGIVTVHFTGDVDFDKMVF